MIRINIRGNCYQEGRGNWPGHLNYTGEGKGISKLSPLHYIFCDVALDKEHEPLEVGDEIVIKLTVIADNDPQLRDDLGYRTVRRVIPDAE